MDNVLNLDGIDFEIVFENEVTRLNTTTNADDKILCSASKESDKQEVSIITTK